MVHILDCWDVLQGEVWGTNPLTYYLLAKSTHPGMQASAADLVVYNTAKAVWNNKNTQVLGLMQATVSPVIWQNYVQYVAKDSWDTGIVESCRESSLLVHVCLLGYLLDSSSAWIYNLCLIGNGTSPTGPCTPLQMKRCPH